MGGTNVVGGNDSGKTQIGQVNPPTKAAPAKATKAQKPAGAAKVTNINTGTGRHNTQVGVVTGNISISR